MTADCCMLKTGSLQADGALPWRPIAQMSFAGLSMHASKELLREKGIIGPEEYGGDTSKRVDDLADLFASMQAS